MLAQRTEPLAKRSFDRGELDEVKVTKKRQPQIFFGIAIIRSAYAIQLTPTRSVSGFKQYCWLNPFASQTS
ncbi:MAG TPA: hypothetical protein PLX87_06305 [Bacteroidales bacterium]|nr:hypothetical protein [Bacteroidales bacterium]HOK75771.1 hypothetical protein [Bacteroidales bacterium]